MIWEFLNVFWFSLNSKWFFSGFIQPQTMNILHTGISGNLHLNLHSVLSYITFHFPPFPSYIYFSFFLPCYTFPKSFRRAVITVFEWRVCLPYVYCLLTKKSRKNAGHMIWFDFHMIWSHDSKTGVIFGLRWLLVLEARFGFFSENLLVKFSWKCYSFTTKVQKLQTTFFPKEAGIIW